MIFLKHDVVFCDRMVCFGGERVGELFGSEEIACKFEEEEIDGKILLSSTVRSNEALEKLGLCTIGKKGKFLEKTEELAGTHFSLLILF